MTEEIPQGDWHRPSDEGVCTTNEVFIQQFSTALHEYLDDTLGEGKHHIVDFAVSASAFATAFYHVSNNF